MRPQVSDVVVHHLNTAAANKSGGAVSFAQHDDGDKKNASRAGVSCVAPRRARWLGGALVEGFGTQAGDGGGVVARAPVGIPWGCLGIPIGLRG